MTCPRTLHPVVFKVPATIRGWQGRRHVRALSRLARAAARQSARESGGRLGMLTKSAGGVPQPSKGWYWSVAHKPDYVAGVVGPGPLGIDIEPLRERSPNLFAKIADQTEWDLGHEARWRLFYRFWTAKEAVLKAVGVGLRGLSECRVIRIDDAACLTVAFRGQPWTVRQRFQRGHWAAVASGGHPVVWHWPDRPAEPSGI